MLPWLAGFNGDDGIGGAHRGRVWGRRRRRREEEEVRLGHFVLAGAIPVEGMVDDELRVRASRAPMTAIFSGDFLDTRGQRGQGEGAESKKLRARKSKEGRSRAASLSLSSLANDNELRPRLGFSSGQRGDEQGFAPGSVLRDIVRGVTCGCAKEGRQGLN
jgi:hypothetical protein